jgi:hypothetical protein
MEERKVYPMSILRIFAIPEVKRRMLLEAAPVVVAVRLLLWLLPSRMIIRWTRRIATSATRGSHPRTSSSTIVWAVESLSRRVPRASCLTQALSAQWLLRRHGYDSRLCLGVATGGSREFAAHAWLEMQGRVIIGGPKVSRFIPLPDFADSHRASPTTRRL